MPTNTHPSYCTHYSPTRNPLYKALIRPFAYFVACDPPKYILNWIVTLLYPKSLGFPPRKINMEPEKDDLEDDFPFQIGWFFGSSR